MANLLGLSEASSAILQKMIALLYILPWIEEDEIFNQGCGTSTWSLSKHAVNTLDSAIATRSFERREEVRDIGLIASHARMCSGTVLVQAKLSEYDRKSMLDLHGRVASFSQI